VLEGSLRKSGNRIRVFTRGAHSFGKAFGHDIGPRLTIRLSG
jgi:hypothetical protein